MFSFRLALLSEGTCCNGFCRVLSLWQYGGTPLQNPTSAGRLLLLEEALPVAKRKAVAAVALWDSKLCLSPLWPRPGSELAPVPDPSPV